MQFGFDGRWRKPFGKVFYSSYGSKPCSIPLVTAHPGLQGRPEGDEDKEASNSSGWLSNILPSAGPSSLMGCL
jgi:hypothetical protein